MSQTILGWPEDYFSGGAHMADSDEGLRKIFRQLLNDGVVFCREVAITAGAGGGADDVTIPGIVGTYKLVDVVFDVIAEVAANTVTLRDTAGGAGTAFTNAMDAGTAATRVRNALGIALPALTSEQDLYLRRSDSAIGGTLLLFLKANITP